MYSYKVLSHSPFLHLNVHVNLCKLMNNEYVNLCKLKLPIFTHPTVVSMEMGMTESWERETWILEGRKTPIPLLSPCSGELLA